MSKGNPFSRVAQILAGKVLAPEAGQPAAWLALDSTWASSFEDDQERIRVYVDWLAHRL